MSNKAEKIVGFMDVIEKLCYIKRYTIMADGRNENDSDHIMKLCFWVMMIAPYLEKKADTQKMLEMALVHDLVEADCGDTPFSDQLKNPDIAQVKKQKEELAIEKYKKALPEPLGSKVYDLFMEYEEHETLEAKLVKILDIFEGNLQCNKENFGKRYHTNPNAGVRINAMSEHKYSNSVEESIIRELEDVLAKISFTNKAMWVK